MDTLGDRMKKYYEDAYRIYLPRRMPYIIRLDGKSFHTFTRNLEKPYCEEFANVMINTAWLLLDSKDANLKIQNAKLAYIQSDEISILCTDYDTLTTEAWFQKNLQKIVSISAAIATAHFNKVKRLELPSKSELGVFDSRVFVLPKEEVANYFIWRQIDATRNSIQGLGQKYFSHKELHKLSCNEIQDKLFKEKDVNWNEVPTMFKRGACIVTANKGSLADVDLEVPIFSEDRNYIERFVYEQKNS